MGLAVASACKSITAGQGHLLPFAVCNDAARQVADQALLDPLDVVGPYIGSAAEPRVDAVDDLALGELLRYDFAARFDGGDGRRDELHACQVPRYFHDVGDGQVPSADFQRSLGR
ncbi:hypothetical protein VD0002_g7196 [Verticillium dahliae]|nr:hypothetical protein VD0002_g7196 [Verticillium dahliae]